MDVCFESESSRSSIVRAMFAVLVALTGSEDRHGDSTQGPTHRDAEIEPGEMTGMRPQANELSVADHGRDEQRGRGHEEHVYPVRLEDEGKQKRVCEQADSEERGEEPA